MFNKIIVAFDGSRCAGTALDKAIELARLTAASLSILTVYRHHGALEATMWVDSRDFAISPDNETKAAARKVAEAAKARALDAGVADVHAYIRPGNPARTIVAESKTQGADLIVIGSRGLGSAERFLLGSVSHKVTGLAECPVLVV